MINEANESEISWFGNLQIRKMAGLQSRVKNIAWSDTHNKWVIFLHAYLEYYGMVPKLDCHENILLFT